MKKIKFLAFAAMAATALSFSACSEDKTEPKDPGTVTPETSSKCEITAFKLVLSDGTKIDGKVYSKEKEIEIVYKSTVAELIKAATAEIVCSDKATVAPAPTTAKDYSNSDVKFTVTAENGTSTAVYTVLVEVQEVQMTTEIEALWTKTVASGELNSSDKMYRGTGIAVSGKDIAITNTYTDGDATIGGGEGAKIFSPTGALLGELNTEGMTVKRLIAMTNDVNGIMLASVNNPTTTEMDPNDGNKPKAYEIWAWKNGWNAAPEIYLSSVNNISRYISIAGDVNGKHILAAQNGNSDRGAHYCWVRDGGTTTEYIPVETLLPSNDGSWGQMLTATTADPLDPFFLYDSRSIAGGGLGEVFGMEGAKGAPQLLNGPGCWLPNINGDKGWGGYSQGSARAFTFNKIPYCVACTSEWGGAHFTIVSNDNEEQISYQYMAYGYGSIGSAAYYYNAAEKCGYVYCLVPGIGACAYKLTGKEVI